MTLFIAATRAELQKPGRNSAIGCRPYAIIPIVPDNSLNASLTIRSGLDVHLSFDVNEDVTAPFLICARPKVAILREQGVNGHVEMAAAFDRAGFTSVDVHMTDIIHGRVSLRDFTGLVACGGFSYGDVLGAGGGWAKSILFNPRARDEFAAFFHVQIPLVSVYATVVK